MIAKMRTERHAFFGVLEGYGNDNPGAFQSTPSARRATAKIYNITP